MPLKIAVDKWLRKAIIAGIVLSLIMLTVVAVITYLAYQRAEAALVIERDEQLTFLSALRLQSELSKFTSSLEDIAIEIPPQNQASGTAQKAFKKVDYLVTDFDAGVVLLDTFGRVVTSEPFRADIIDQDWSDRTYVMEVINTNSPVFSDMVFDGPNKSAVIAVCIPVRNSDGQFGGVLAGMFQLGKPTISTFYASIVRLRMGQTGSTYIVDGNGNIIYDSAFIRVGQPFLNKGIDSLQVDHAQAIRIRDEENHEIVSSYAKIPGTTWTLILEDDWEMLITPVQRYVNLLLVFVILGIAVPSFGIRVLFQMRNRELLRHTQTEREMQIARLMKQRISGQQMPLMHGWNLEVSHHPSKIVSGDYFDLMFLPDGRLMVSMADVTEKGMEAMLKIAALRAAFRGAAQSVLGPAQTLEQCNKLLSPDILPDKTIHAFYGLVDPSSGALTYSMGGQLNVFLLDGDQTSPLPSTGDPLGLSISAIYEEGAIHIKTNGRILLCNAGVTGLRNSKGERYGGHRLLEYIQTNFAKNSNMIEGMIAELTAFSGGKLNLESDLTILLLERGSSGAEHG